MWRQKVLYLSRFYAAAFLVAFDVCIITISLFVAAKIRFDGIAFGHFFNLYTGATFITYGSFLLACYLFNLYDAKNFIKKGADPAVLFASLVGAITVIVASFVIPNWKVGRSIFLIQSATFFVLAVLARRPFYYRLIYSRLIARKRVLLIGNGKSAVGMANFLEKEFDSDFEIVGFVSKEPSAKSNHLGQFKDIRHLVQTKRIDLVISCLSYAESSKLIKDLFYVKMQGCEVTDMPVLYSKLAKKIPIQYIGDEWFVYGPYFSYHRNPLVINFTRFIDIFLSSTTLILSAPLWLLCVLGIKITMPGPVLFFQTRLGLNKKPYRVIKFRSMKIDAETKTGPVWSKGPSDPRVTPFGAFLRRTRLDELPQLINIFKGDMSFIGPRPERPYFVGQLSKKIPYYDLRFSVKPGLTGWAQVNMGYAANETDSLEKLQYDLYYIQETSLFLNILILFKTLQTIISKKGS